MKNKKKFRLKTVGCKVNQAEGEGIRERFLKSGYEEAGEQEAADIIIVNTCTVTASADSKSRSLIRSLHRRNPRARIWVTGCYAEKDGQVISQIKGVSSVIPQSKKKSLILPISRFKGHTRAFLKIQDGCSRNCSYCKVRIVRGPSKSRPVFEILEEAERLIRSGHREIVLTGIQLGAYGKDLEPKTSLTDAVKKILDLDGLLRLRLSSLEPGDVSRSLIALMAEEKRIARHLHIPLQSGNDAVLKRMRRGYTRGSYRDLIGDIQSRIADFCLSTDVMVGFPGETEDAFRDSCEIIREIRPLKVHVFPYSVRKGTDAESFRETTAVDIKKRRARLLLRTAKEIADKKKEDFLGKDLKVLIEEHHPASGYYRGHTANYLPVAVKSRGDLINQEILVCAEKLDGEFILAKIKNL